MGFLGRGERDQLSSSLQVTGGLAPGPQLQLPPQPGLRLMLQRSPKGARTSRISWSGWFLGLSVVCTAGGKGTGKGWGRGWDLDLPRNTSKGPRPRPCQPGTTGNTKV